MIVPLRLISNFWNDFSKRQTKILQKRRYYENLIGEQNKEYLPSLSSRNQCAGCDCPIALATKDQENIFKCFSKRNSYIALMIKEQGLLTALLHSIHQTSPSHHINSKNVKFLLREWNKEVGGSECLFRSTFAESKNSKKQQHKSTIFLPKKTWKSDRIVGKWKSETKNT